MLEELGVKIICETDLEDNDELPFLVVFTKRTMKITQMKTKHLNDFVFWDEQWKENTEQETQQGGGPDGSTSEATNDPKGSRG